MQGNQGITCILTIWTKMQNLKLISKELRQSLVQISHDSKIPHLGSCLSCIDILVCLYWKLMKISPQSPQDPKRDRFFLSKGHAANALYVTLAKKGFFDEALLKDLDQNGSILPEHPVFASAPGIELSSGSLGHALPIATGLALGAQIDSLDYKVFVLMGDGECNEGSIWEAALQASQKKLKNIVAIVDYNKWQATGRSQEISSLESLSEKFSSFGWQSFEVDGHDHELIIKELESKMNQNDRPIAMIAHTKKGSGISFMEDDNNWHYRIPNDEEVQAALKELNL